MSIENYNNKVDSIVGFNTAEAIEGFMRPAQWSAAAATTTSFNTAEAIEGFMREI